MMSEPDAWHALMIKLSEVVGAYLLAQARAGAQALQLFDSWCGELSPADYEASVASIYKAHNRHRPRSRACRSFSLASTPAACSR